MGCILLVVAGLCLCSQVQGIYEEQAGQYDWHNSQIGKVTNAKFAFRSKSRAFVSTEAGVVAALDLRDGSVLWRQVLEQSEQIDQLVLLPKPAAVATLSAQSRQDCPLEAKTDYWCYCHHPTAAHVRRLSSHLPTRA